MHTELSPSPQWTPEDLEKCKETNISFYSTKWPASYFPFQKLLNPVQTDATLLTNNFLHCWMSQVLSVCTPCCKLLDFVAQSLKPVKLFSQQLPTFLLFRDRRSVAQQCWIRLIQHCCATLPTLLGLRTLITHGLQRLMGCILPTIHCRSQHCRELLRPFARSLREKGTSFQCKDFWIVWVDKSYLWLVNSCLEYHRPNIISTCPPKRSLKSLFPTLVPVLLKGSEVKNSTR